MRLTSYSWMTFGCLTIFKMWISRVTLSTSLWSLILSFSKIFIATFSPVIRWVPSLTLPKVPCPSDRPIMLAKIAGILTYNIMANRPVGIWICILWGALGSFSCWKFSVSFLITCDVCISASVARASSSTCCCTWGHSAFSVITFLGSCRLGLVNGSIWPWCPSWLISTSIRHFCLETY